MLHGGWQALLSHNVLHLSTLNFECTAFEHRVDNALVGAALRAVPSFGSSARPAFDNVAVRWASAGSTCSCQCEA